MTVKEAREILAEHNDTPLHELSEDEVENYRQAMRVVEAARINGEDIFGAIGREVGRAARAVGRQFPEGREAEDSEQFGIQGPPVIGRFEEFGGSPGETRQAVARTQTDLAIAEQKLNVHDRAVTVQTDERPAGGEPEQMLPTAQAAREIAQEQLDRAAAKRQREEAAAAKKAAKAKGPLVGVNKTLEEGFLVERDLMRREGSFGLITGDVQDSTKEVRAQYREMDVLEFSGKSQEEIIAQQKKMVDAGLLEEGEYWPGWWGSKSQNAYRTALGLANESGKNVDDVIHGLVRSNRVAGEQGDGGRAARLAEIKSRAFTPPDYKTLAQTTKEYAEGQLGRDMKDYEVQLMADELKSAYRARHEAEIQADVAEFRAQEDAGEEGEPQDAGEVPTPDPTEHFKAAFEERFGKEIEHKEQVEEKHDNHQLLMRSLRGMDRLVG